ncbi:MAG: thioredoxin domain-containing protein [Bacteroidetes bacterium]|nr:thioredoxin domain-containing protein [Bacteroidota bacterium]
MVDTAIDTERDHVFGCRFAPVELVLYGDFRCTHCGFVFPEIKLLQETMGDQLQFAFRHYVIPNRYPLSLDTVIASEVAAMQDKFWNMHDALFENQYTLTRSGIIRLGESIDIDMSLFENAYAYRKLAQKVLRDFEIRVRSGVNSTPTFFINGLRYNGAADFEGLYKACRYVLLLQEAELEQPVRN